MRSLWQDNRGSALVEGAIVVPVLFAMMFGIYEFSWFFYQQHVISIGLRDGARYLARVSNPCDPSSLNWPIEEEYAKNLATTGMVNGDAARVKGWTSAMVTILCTPIDNPVKANGLSAYRGGYTVYIVTASTKFTDPSLGFFGFLGLQSPVISVAHSQRVIGHG
jgi:Flp pilus assembly protein TadG